MPSAIYTAPPNTGTVTLGKTLPDLLYDACARYERPAAFNQPTGDGGWEPLSLDAFRQRAEEVALGLLETGLERGDRVAFYMPSDVYFCLCDMGCLLAGLIDVPIYLTHTGDATQYVIDHAEARAVIVGGAEHLRELEGVLAQTPRVETVILSGEDALPDDVRLPEHVRLVLLSDLREEGRKRHEADPKDIERHRAAIDPHDLATIIYTSGTTGLPKGVMLTHENISSNATTAFSGMVGYEDDEVALSFLPLTHIFARTLYFGLLYRGTSIYFCHPDEVGDKLKEVRPTVFATVPRVLEKVYARILEKAEALTGLKKQLLRWALDLAGRYELGETPRGLFALQLKLADTLVFSKWREALGGRVKFVICGGAALNARFANLFGAAGVNVLQGYGLTETSPVITYNRPDRNRAGTVGEPLPGVEVRIDDNGEVLTRGPHVMQGYYKDPEKTAAAIDADGWFHTGDVGQFNEEGFLCITDRIKDLFKLSTGKYVVPQPLENRLTREPLVEQAVVVGEGHKYCTVLIFPEHEALRNLARGAGLDGERPVAALVTEQAVQARYQELVDEANAGMDPWSTIKRFVLIPEHLTPENGLLTPTLKVKRRQVRERFADEIEALYDERKGVRARAHAT